MKNNIQVDMLKDNDILDFKTKSHENRYNNFIESIPNGSKVEIFVSITTDKGTNAQLARVHVMIRELASTLGYTFEEMKLLVKRRAGLCIVKNGTESCKSFADCDREDLNLVIQALIELGDSLDTNLR